MRKRIMLSLGLLLACCSIGWSQGPVEPFCPIAALVTSIVDAFRSSDSRVIADLLRVAKSGEPLEARISALDVLGRLATKDPAAVRMRLQGLRKLIKHPPAIVYVPTPGEDPEKALLPQKVFFLRHAVFALGTIGPSAKAALPEIAAVTGQDPGLDGEIAGAIRSILKPIPPVTTAPAPASADIINSWLQDLSGGGPSKRLAAAKSLRDNFDAAHSAAVFAALLNAMQNDGDAEVRLVAAESAEKVSAPAKGKSDYVKALIEMLKDKNPVVRLGAARALGAVGKDAAGALPMLDKLIKADPDADADVQSVARNASKKILAKP